ncbi:MAG: M28 family peptidase [Bacteroidales bacterium]|nr:M28 family peptidase [Bacteroidales bacterium]
MAKKYSILLLFALFCGLFFTQCEKKKEKKGQSVEESLRTPPAYSADSAFLFVKAQTDFGPRVPNTPAHKQCLEFLKQTLAEYCDTLYCQEFTAKAYDGTELKSCNIIGSFAPEKTKRIVLASHWDSRPFADHDAEEANRQKPIDGANDGASGVGVLLEVARQLSLKSPEVGVDIVFFDAEDYGTPEGVSAPEGEWWGLGSQYWSQKPHIPGYRALYGILLDMVGNANARFRHEGFSELYGRSVINKVWGTAGQLGYGDVFLNATSHPITDDHYYVNTLAGFPMIDIIHQEDYTGTGFPATWHTLNDNIEHIDKNMLAIVGTTLLAVIYDEK